MVWKNEHFSNDKIRPWLTPCLEDGHRLVLKVHLQTHTRWRYAVREGPAIWQAGCLFGPGAASPSPPRLFLPAAHDGAVEEVVPHGGPQHPQQQAHQQEAGALPEGEARAPGAWLHPQSPLLVSSPGPASPFSL